MPKTAKHSSAEPLLEELPLLPADSEDSQLTTLLRVYLSQAEIEQVWDAYRYSDGVHKGQMRISGEPYISHPVLLLAFTKLHLDVPTLLAALLHDVVEDSEVSKEELSERFGKQVADLVDGLTKLDKIELQTAVQAQAENVRKMLLAMSQDVTCHLG